MKKNYLQNYGDTKGWWICVVSITPIFLLAVGIWYKALFVPVTVSAEEIAQIKARYWPADQTSSNYSNPHSPSEAELIYSAQRKMNEGLQDQMTWAEKAALENEKERRAKQIEKESY